MVASRSYVSSASMRDAALDVVPQADLTLDRDDRSCLLRRQHRRRDDDFLDGLPGRFLTIEVAEEGRLAEVRQRAADVGLEDHDGREDHVDQHVADHPVEGLQRGEPRQVEQHDDQQRAYRHLNGASSPDQFQELVDQDRDDRDVEQVPPADRRPPEQAGEIFGHRRSSLPQSAVGSRGSAVAVGSRSRRSAVGSRQSQSAVAVGSRRSLSSRS